ncbi:MAG: hypothetical protein CL575_06915, partial [Altererythrobacter sp.]|nr:hypothetical protein [Altererythrobacter sp.]
MKTSREHAATSYNGYVMLGILVVVVAALAFLIPGMAPGDGAAKAAKVGFVAMLFVSAICVLILAIGFFMIQPNQAAVITLFGAYRGSERTEGLRWVWPWMGKTKISARAHNIHSERVKINDLRGNPIEIACNVVWRVRDTAQASFDVDDYKEFVNIQIEAGLRTVGSRHPYDDFESEEVTLRGSADVVNRELL